MAAARAAGPTATNADAAPTGGSDERELAEGIEGLVRASRASAGEKSARVVEEAVWRILRPWQRSSAAGAVRYWYIGQTIDAVIHDDGSLEIRNKAGLILSPTSYQTLAGAQPGSNEPSSMAFGSPSGVGVGVGITDPGRTVQKVVTGKSQGNAETQRLLSQTRALRDRLLVDDGRRQAFGAVERLSSALQKLWAGRASLELKRERTFALWDQCADDSTGEEGRRRIEAFIRLHQESDGHCLYSPDQLARLNAGRTSKRAFSPCLEPGASKQMGEEKHPADAGG